MQGKQSAAGAQSSTERVQRQGVSRASVSPAVQCRQHSMITALSSRQRWPLRSKRERIGCSRVYEVMSTRFGRIYVESTSHRVLGQIGGRSLFPVGCRGESPAASDDVELVRLDVLLPAADSRRIGEEGVEHVRALGNLTCNLPTILVEQSTMQNAKHGMPLVPVGRAAAASRILGARPLGSNARIAAVAGISDESVTEVPKRLTSETPTLSSRIGRDGRVSPIGPAEGRLRAPAHLSEEPNALLRDIAQAAGVALATAKDVLARVYSEGVPCRCDCGRLWPLHDRHRVYRLGLVVLDLSCLTLLHRNLSNNSCLTARATR